MTRAKKWTYALDRQFSMSASLQAVTEKEEIALVISEPRRAYANLLGVQVEALDMQCCVGVLLLCVGGHHLPLIVSEREEFVAADRPELDSGVFNCPLVARGHQRFETGQVRKQSILALQPIQALHLKILKCRD